MTAAVMQYPQVRTSTESWFGAAEYLTGFGICACYLPCGVISTAAAASSVS